MDRNFLSVIVCTYNRADILRKSLDSLCCQSVDKNIFEVIIVDNNSNDTTREVVKRYCAENNNFKYIFEGKQGHSQARNRGLIESKSEFVAFLDDDAVADKNWIRSILKCYEETDADVVGGPVFSVFYGENTPFYYNNKLFDFNLGQTRKRLSSPGFDFGFSAMNVCFKKELFQKHGVFSENFGIVKGKLLMGEDSEIGYRLIKSGSTFYYEPEMIINHILRKEIVFFKGIIFRSFNSGLGIGNIIRKDLSFSGKIKKVAAPVVYLLLFLILFPFYFLNGTWYVVKKMSDISFSIGVVFGVFN